MAAVPAPAAGSSGRNSGSGTRASRARAQPRALGGGFARGSGHPRGGVALPIKAVAALKAARPQVPRPRPPAAR